MQWWERTNPDGWLLLEDDSPVTAAMVAGGCTVAEGGAVNLQTPPTRAVGGCAGTKAYQPWSPWPARPRCHPRPPGVTAPWEDIEGRGRGTRGSPRTLWGRAPSSHAELQKASVLPVHSSGNLSADDEKHRDVPSAARKGCPQVNGGSVIRSRTMQRLSFGRTWSNMSCWSSTHLRRNLVSAMANQDSVFSAQNVKRRREKPLLLGCLLSIVEGHQCKECVNKFI